MLEYQQKKIISLSKLQEAVEKRYNRKFSHPFVHLITSESYDEDSVMYYYFADIDKDDFYSKEQILIRKFLRKEFPNDDNILIDLYW